MYAPYSFQSFVVLIHKSIAEGAFNQGEWMAKGLESPTKFTAIDLAEGEWYDFDEKSGEEVSVKDVKWEIRRA